MGVINFAAGPAKLPDEVINLFKFLINLLKNKYFQGLERSPRRADKL